MKNKWTANWGLKIASFLFAAVLWLFVTNINNPLSSYIVRNVPVKIINGNLITDTGQIYEVLDGTDSVDSVTVKAPRSVIDNLGDENVFATADMKDRTSDNTIPIRFYTNKYNTQVDSIKGSIDSVKLSIENKKTKAFDLKAVSTGTVTEGYLLGDISTDQNLVIVSGPESAVTKVAQAVVEVDVTGFTRNIGTDAEIILYDEEGNQVPDDNLTKNIDSVHVTIPILETRRIPIHYTTSGKPASGYRTTGVIESTPDTVLIAGKSSTIKNISSIEIPDTVLDVTGQSSDMTEIVDVKKYLPDGVILGDSRFKGKASVTVYIAPEVTRDLNIPKTAITFANLPEGYTAELAVTEDTLPITVAGLEAGVNALAASSVTGTVDVNGIQGENPDQGLQPGTYSVKIDFALPEHLSLRKGGTVDVTIAETEAEAQ